MNDTDSLLVFRLQRLRNQPNTIRGKCILFYASLEHRPWMRVFLAVFFAVFVLCHSLSFCIMIYECYCVSCSLIVRQILFMFIRTHIVLSRWLKYCGRCCSCRSTLSSSFPSLFSLSWETFSWRKRAWWHGIETLLACCCRDFSSHLSLCLPSSHLRGVSIQKILRSWKSACTILGSRWSLSWWSCSARCFAYGSNSIYCGQHSSCAWLHS